MAKVEMKTSEAKEITRKAIALAIVKHRDKIIALLKKNGVSIDGNDDDKLIVAVMIGVRDSARFRKELAALLADTTKETMSFTAEYNTFFFTGSEAFFNALGSSSVGDSAGSSDDGGGNSSGGNGSGSSTYTGQSSDTPGGALKNLFSDPKTLSSILNTGLTTLSNALTNKSNQKLANTALQIEAEKTKQAALLAGSRAVIGAGGTGLSTVAKIGIGVGVAAVVGVIIWLIVKKK